jgi:hypothetical protein
LVFLVILPVDAREVAHSFSFRNPSTLKIDGKSFDLATSKGFSEFQVCASKLLQEGSPGAGAASLAKKDLRGIREMLRLADVLNGESDASERRRLERQIAEIAAAIANNHRPVIPAYVGLPDLPFRFFDSLSNPVGKGRKRALNLEECEYSSDLSLLDPERSTFWQRPRSLAMADLYSGFGRTNLPRFDGRVWNYVRPKTTGGNPGCELASGSLRIKVKFGETHCEPFVSRVFHALGYFVDPVDYSPRLKMRYDRRYFTEFNRLPELKMKIGLFFIPIHTFHFERVYDPLNFIEEAVMSDGTRLPREAFADMLLRNRDAKDRFAAQNFNEEVENSIDHLVTSKANVQIKSESGGSIGPWAFDQLGHEHLRELRGAGVLAGWVSWWDARFENTRLRVVETDSGPTLRHYFSDLGAGLGRAAGTFSHSSEKEEDFASTFTRRSKRFGQERIEYPGFEPIENNAAFKEMTFDDARWMARLIAELSEAQIIAALKASGFSDEEVAVYAAKLLSRREQLLRDTGLVSEVSASQALTR